MDDLSPLVLAYLTFIPPLSPDARATTPRIKTKPLMRTLFFHGVTFAKTPPGSESPEEHGLSGRDICL